MQEAYGPTKGTIGWIKGCPQTQGNSSLKMFSPLRLNHGLEEDVEDGV